MRNGEGNSKSIRVSKSHEKRNAKRNKKAEEIGLGTNGCLKILSVRSTIKKVDVDEMLKRPMDYTEVTHVVLKALENTDEGVCLKGNRATIFVDYFDITGDPLSGDKKDFSVSSKLSSIRKGETKAFDFISNEKIIGSFRVWIEED